jgi:hypothetical protein
MSMGKKLALIFGGLILIGVIIFPLFNGPTDEEMILEVLQQSADASEAGQPGGVLDALSRTITYNGRPVSDRSEVAEFIKTSHPSIDFLDLRTTIEEDEANVLADIELGMAGGLGPKFNLNGVEIRLAKETGTKWLIIPTPKWRIVEIKTPSFDAGSLGPAF